MARIVVAVFGLMIGCCTAWAQTPGVDQAPVVEAALPDSPGSQVFGEVARVELPEAAMQAQQPGAMGALQGTVTDKDDALVPGASVVAVGPDTQDKVTVTADGNGAFTLRGLRSGVNYKVTVSSKGFNDFSASEVMVGVGQVLNFPVKLSIAEVQQEVTAVSAQELAIEQVNAEVTQRVFGVIPNFYVVYDQTFVPLSTKLKYKLAFKASTDVVSFGAVFLALIDQAAFTPSYVEGMKGFGQRVGAVYADATTDIFFGGAILPALFHQDPRYFYDGIDTKKQRAMHAILSPFICKGDKGNTEFNISSVGGDLISGALSNLYYPTRDRGVGLVFSSAAISLGGRVANALAQEFILSRFTSKKMRPN